MCKQHSCYYKHKKQNHHISLHLNLNLHITVIIHNCIPACKQAQLIWLVLIFKCNTWCYITIPINFYEIMSNSVILKIIKKFRGTLWLIICSCGNTFIPVSFKNIFYKKDWLILRKCPVFIRRWIHRPKNIINNLFIITIAFKINLV